MQPITPDQRRQITNYMRSRRRQWQALEARRYPRGAIDTRTYIEDFNELNRSPYRQRLTLDFQQ